MKQPASSYEPIVGDDNDNDTTSIMSTGSTSYNSHSAAPSSPAAITTTNSSNSNLHNQHHPPSSFMNYPPDSPLAAAFLPPVNVTVLKHHQQHNSGAHHHLHHMTNDLDDTHTIHVKDMSMMNMPSAKQLKEHGPTGYEDSIGMSDQDESKLHLLGDAGLPAPSTAVATAPAKPPAPTQKLIYFEGLRGIAALQVVFIHTLHYFKMLDNYSRMYQHWSSAVPIFFILSGGIITRSIIQANFEKKSTPVKLLKKLFSSFVRRPFRFLIPLYFGSLYKMMLIQYFGLKVDKEHGMPESAWQFFGEPLRFLIYADGPFPPFMPVPSWTLFPEMLGSMVIYMVTAVLIPFAENARVRIIVLSTMFFFFFITDNWAFYFIIGYAISDMTISGATARFNRWRFSTLVKILMLVVSVAVTYEFSDFATEDAKEVASPNPVRKQLMTWLGDFKIHTNPGWNFPLNSLLVFYSATIFWLIESTPVLQRVLSVPPVAYLGRISFMLYLLHQDTAIMLQPRTEHLLLEKTYTALWKKFFFETGVCLLVADLATRIFDEPLQKVVRRWEEAILFERWRWVGVLEWPRVLGQGVLWVGGLVLESFWEVKKKKRGVGGSVGSGEGVSGGDVCVGGGAKGSKKKE
ncbi:hypothetical protein HDU97_008265 [Phlyctochytrium planicorne]|nr:hypothetical protein HDU97_008265 [Phlyctochytrium planicorne]